MPSKKSSRSKKSVKKELTNPILATNNSSEQTALVSTEKPKVQFLDEKDNVLEEIEIKQEEIAPLITFIGDSIGGTPMDPLSPSPSAMMSYVTIPKSEKQALAYKTGKGRFLTFGITKDAFKHRWVPRQALGSTDKLTPDDISLFEKTLEKFDIKKKVFELIGRARTYGQCAAALTHQVPGNSSTPKMIRVIDYELTNLYYHPTTHKLAYLQVPIVFGNYANITQIPPKQLCLFKNDEHPEGFLDLGHSVLDSVYFYIRAATVIMDTWSKLYNQRGLGLVKVKIMGGTERDIQKAKEQWKDPSQFSMMVFNDRIDVTTEPGINAGYNIKETNEMFMKEVSSGSGVSFTKLDGGNTYVSGVLADQDNYAANHQLLHEEWHDTIVELIELCEPKLKGKIAIDFIIEIKLDKTQQVSVYATYLTMALSCPEIFSLNDVLRFLDKDIERDGDSVTFAEYIYNERVRVYGPEMVAAISGIEGGSEGGLFQERVGKNDSKVKGNVNLDLKNARKDLSNKSKNMNKTVQQNKSTPFADTNEISAELKRNIAKAILQQNKSLSFENATSVPKIREILQTLYNQSLSPTTIQDCKKEVEDMDFTHTIDSEIVKQGITQFTVPQGNLSLLDIIHDMKTQKAYSEFDPEEIIGIALELHKRSLSK
jgi:hypothetical protein